LSALPERPDCALLAVPNEGLLPVLQEAAALGIPAAVIFASAYTSPAAGQPGIQAQLAGVARAYDMVICGPNCMGFLALERRLAVCGYQTDPSLPCGHVAFISHSGSIWDAFLQNRRGVHFNYAISSGNEMVTTLADYMRFVLADPLTRVIGLFLETVRDPQTFRAALATAAERDIPVVALKVGRTEQGARLAQAHSGALAGIDAAYEALFAYYEVRRVKSPDEMLDTLELMAAGFRPPSRHVTAICDSGGQRAMLVDLAEEIGVEFAPLAPATTGRLAALLEPGLDPVNPLDAWGTGNDYTEIYRACLLALDSDPATGLNIFAVDLTAANDFSPSYVEVALAVQPYLTKPLLFLLHVAAAAGSNQIGRLRQAGIPVLLGSETGLRAIRHLLEYSHAGRRRRLPLERDAYEAGLPPAEVAEIRELLRQAAGPLDEYASKQILRAYGLPAVPEALAASLAEALQAAEAIGYPVALKTAAGALHKSEQGGVRLNLATPADLTAAYHDIAGRLGSRVLVQQMSRPGLELLLGLVNDAQFGPMLALGSGGILVELLQDYRLLMLPTTPDEVRQALLGLRGAALFQGVRGQAPVDIEGVVAAAMRLASLSADLGDLVAEVDINPLIARPEGVMVVDALIVPGGDTTPNLPTGGLRLENNE
jgi:acyl-CoA synthetase (NDP forming)